MAERIKNITIASAKALVIQAEFMEQIYNRKSSDRRVPLAYNIIEQEERRQTRIFDNAQYNAQENRRKRVQTKNVYSPTEKASRITSQSSYYRPLRWY